ncbi:MAG TPA: tripartite tricarboxylate transporter substrate binding protein [Pseudolabrys sp.]|nr:tripartite tricarboxylate transporter substrate binding protein [Pseudolabrys sp.]
MRTTDQPRIGRRMLLALAAVLLAVPFVAPAQAKWPERPVKLVLPFGAGGVADVTSRIVADKLGEKFGQRFYVENMPGPGGINAARAVITAAPDGYTLGLVTNGTPISVALFKKLPFDPVKDFEMISMLGQFDLEFAVNPASPYKTLGDFIKAANEKPGELNIGTIAVGSTQNLGAELFKSMAEIKAQIVSYKNSPDVVVALLRNDVQMLVEFPPAIQGQVNDKKLTVVATSSPKRSPLEPNYPTVDEAGVKGYEVTSWNGVFAPKGTPKEIVDAMNQAMREILAQPDLKARFATVGVLPAPSSPEELMTRLTTDIKKYNDIVDKAGIERK